MKNILWLFPILLLFVSAAIAQTLSVPAAVVVKLRHQAQMTYEDAKIPHNEEYAAAVLSDGSVLYTLVSDRGGNFSLSLGFKLLLHTPPNGVQSEPAAETRRRRRRYRLRTVW